MATVAEDWVSIAALSVMAALPVVEMIARTLRLNGVPGSAVFVQHLTLWVALLGAAIAARSGRLLSLSTSAFLPEKWRPAAGVFSAAITGAVSLGLAWASFQFVRVERQAGNVLADRIPMWVAESIMPLGFAVIAVRAVWGCSKVWARRAAAAAGLVLPLILGASQFLQASAGPALGIAVLLAATGVGLPVFAGLGGLGMLLFWKSGIAVAAVPVQAYQIVSSPLLPSIPLFTFAGYLLAEGGASRRLLRVFDALFGWLPGGPAVVVAAVCGFFTVNGSGATILSLGGLMLPVLLKARYPERFSIGLLTASGSLGLLFPPSLPVILYGVYSHTPIDRLFIGGFVPGLLMVALASAWGVQQGLRSGAVRGRFSWREAREALWEAKWELALPAIVIVCLFGGVASLVETSAVAVLYSFVVECLVFRDLSLRRDYARVAVECATVVGGVLVILGAAMGLTNYLVQAQIPMQLVAWVTAHIHSKVLFLLLLNVFLLAIGCLDSFAAIIVVVPLITPMGAAFGVDPVQLGIIFLANLELGYMTPPLGMNLFLSACRFGKPVAEVSRATLPFWLILLGGVLVITYVPALTTVPVRWVGR